MATDSLGNTLQVGDRVNIPCVVVEVQEDTDDRHHNITMESVHPAPGAGGGSVSRFALSGSQLVKEGAVGASEAPAKTAAFPEPPASVPDPTVVKVLDGTVSDVKEELDSELTIEELVLLRAAEVDGKGRKGVLDAIDARLTELRTVQP